jgi:hypothetical protein
MQRVYIIICFIIFLYFSLYINSLNEILLIGNMYISSCATSPFQSTISAYSISLNIQDIHIIYLITFL